MSNPPPAPPVVPPPGLFARVIDGLRNKTIELVIGAVIAGIGLVIGLIWADSKARTKDFIITSVLEEFGKPDNRFVKPIDEVMGKLRDQEVGAINVGSFTLTPTNSSYSLFLYFPDPQKYSGKLGLAVDGLAAGTRWVVLQPEGSPAIRITSTDPLIDLGGYLKKLNAAEAPSISDIIELPAHLKQLRSLTFQLAGPSTIPGTPQFDSTASITVKYVALIRPAIRVER